MPDRHVAATNLAPDPASVVSRNRSVAGDARLVRFRRTGVDGGCGSAPSVRDASRLGDDHAGGEWKERHPCSGWARRRWGRAARAAPAKPPFRRHVDASWAPVVSVDLRCRWSGFGVGILQLDEPCPDVRSRPVDWAFGDEAWREGFVATSGRRQAGHAKRAARPAIGIELDQEIKPDARPEPPHAVLRLGERYEVERRRSRSTGQRGKTRQFLLAGLAPCAKTCQQHRSATAGRHWYGNIVEAGERYVMKRRSGNAALEVPKTLPGETTARAHERRARP